MNFDEIVKIMKKSMTKKLASSVKNHIAIEFDIEGEGEGAFYIEINDGAPSVEPYNYFDHDARVRADGDELVKIAKGELKATESNIRIEGNKEKADTLLALFEKKAPAKKTAAKKSPAKPVAKKAEPKAEKAPAKPVAKKAEPKAEKAPAKPVAKKAEPKAEKAPAKPAAKKAEPKAEKKADTKITKK